MNIKIHVFLNHDNFFVYERQNTHALWSQHTHTLHTSHQPNGQKWIKSHNVFMDNAHKDKKEQDK